MAVGKREHEVMFTAFRVLPDLQKVKHFPQPVFLGLKFRQKSAQPQKQQKFYVFLLSYILYISNYEEFLQLVNGEFPKWKNEEFSSWVNEHWEH